jgi:hypothetical protein
MGAEDRTRARAAIDAVSGKHRALSATVAAAASWAAAAAARTRQEADDVAWRRTTAELDDATSTGAWDNVLRDYQPLVVWPEYGQHLAELHDDLGAALLGPAAYKSVAGLAPANALRTVKHTMESAWRDDRACRVFDGRLPEAAKIHEEMRQCHDDWVAEVNCAVDVLEQTRFTSLWMRPYKDSVTDRLRHAVPMFREVYTATAWADYEPCLLIEWNQREIPLPKDAFARHWLPTQADVRRNFANRAAFVVDRWIAALIAGGLSEQERDVTTRVLDDRYPEAMAAWRRMCASRVSSGLPAVPVPPALYGVRRERNAS